MDINHICTHCFKGKTVVILLLKRIDQKQNELLQALDRLVDILMKYVNS